MLDGETSRFQARIFSSLSAAGIGRNPCFRSIKTHIVMSPAEISHSGDNSADHGIGRRYPEYIVDAVVNSRRPALRIR